MYKHSGTTGSTTNLRIFTQATKEETTKLIFKASVNDVLNNY